MDAEHLTTETLTQHKTFSVWDIKRRKGIPGLQAEGGCQSSVLSVSEKIKDLELAYNEYNNAIFNPDVPIFSTKKQRTSCGEVLNAITYEDEHVDVITEFSLECSNPNCNKRILVWKQDG